MKYYRLALILCIITFCLPDVVLTPAIASPGLVDGRDVRNNIDNLTRQVLWFSNLRDAEDSARQKNRPLLWVHMLGKIEGAT